LSDAFLIQGISDDLMNRLSPLISSSVPTEAASAQQKSYVAYALSSLASQDEVPPSITLLESRNLLAALHLGQYLCANYPSLVQGRTVLELGAGTGYISILCAKYLHASHVEATDGAEEVIDGLRDNFKLNGLQESPAIDAKQLKWGCTLEDIGHSDFSRGENVDIVLGADVTYDETAITALTSTFEDLFNKHSGVQILIAATLRNLKTFSFFQESCHKRGYDFKEVDCNNSPEKLQMGPFYPDKVPIRICLISRP
jgi:predicted nicotinamide N-methyase